MRTALVALAVVMATACGSQPSVRSAGVPPSPPTTTTTVSATDPTVAPPGPSAVTTAPASAPAEYQVPDTATTAPPPSVSPPGSRLGPEWTQRDGRVLIEAAASGDPQLLLRDLQGLGLTEGVVFGRLVNGWLPIGAVDAAQRLGSLQFIRPTGAGTGTG
ncbi:MAG: hypothetical protein ACRD12_07965 [Acidimicrobiales bacterium]